MDDINWLGFLNGVTFAWLTFWAIRALRDISSRRYRSASFLILVFYLFYGVPLVLDLLVGVPQYSSTPGFRDGAGSVLTCVIYDLFIAICPAFWWLTSRPQRNGSGMILLPGKTVRRCLWVVLASPLMALVFAPAPLAYLHYAAVISGSMDSELGQFHGIIGALSVIAVVAAACLLLIGKSFGRALCLVMPFVGAAIWLQGKRSIVVLAFLLFWSAAWARGMVSRARLVGFGTLSLLAITAYVSWYQAEFRPAAIADSDSAYENSRIDYGRDQNLRAAIFCELNEGNNILEYRGQSVLFSLLMPVPRSMWPDKPWPYAHYLTAHALEIEPTDLGWGLTTSFLDEAVANFGWFGLLIGPCVFGLMCFICDRSKDPVVKVAGILIACLLMAVEFVAFAPLVFAWLLYLGWSKHVLRRIRTRSARGFIALKPIS